MHASLVRRVVAVVIAGSVAVSVSAQQQEKFTNLKVLPKDIAPADLHATMNAFTRALGVRCVYCHVGEEGKPLKHEDFAKDDKPTKDKARAMLRMVKDINENYLAKLASRADPPVAVRCVTCHRGTPQPRMLQDVLTTAYSKGGLDSTVARYQSLRERYYGRFTYDFGDVPLAEVAGTLRESHPEDARQLLALNLEMNPNSAFAKRQLANVSIAAAYRNGADSGRAAYEALKSRFGANVVTEEMMTDVGYQLLSAHRTDMAIAAFRQIVTEHPESANGWDSLGEAYAANGDWKRATEAYTKSLALDATNDNARRQLEELKHKSKQKRPARRGS